MESRSSSFKNIIIGALLGITSMLPGLSGATMAVVFGIYERLIRDIANLKTYLIKDIRFLIFLAAGALAGMLVCAKILDQVLDEYPVECLMFFIGLIAGQIAPLFHSFSEEKGNRVLSTGEKTSFVFGLALMGIMVCMTLMSSFGEVEVRHDMIGIAAMFLVGIIVAVSAILPGLSHSTILLVLGLMDAFLTVVGDLDVVLLIPLAAGLVIGAVGFARLFQDILAKHRLSALLFILGLTIGSIAVIAANIITCDPSAIDLGAGAIILILGLATSLQSRKADRI